MRKATQTATSMRIAVLLACCALPASAFTQAAPPPAAKLPVQAAPGSRQAMLSDTDRLLQLARELKETVDKTRRDELSMQVIREADEIEKLARTAKARIH